jgi:hypothetical protein
MQSVIAAASGSQDKGGLWLLHSAGLENAKAQIVAAEHCKVSSRGGCIKVQQLSTVAEPEHTSWSKLGCLEVLHMISQFARYCSQQDTATFNNTLDSVTDDQLIC